MNKKVYKLLCIPCKFNYKVISDADFNKPLFCPKCGKKEAIIKDVLKII